MPNLKFYSEQTWIKSIQNAMKLEENSKTEPIIRPAETHDEVEKLFDPLSYHKGAFLRE